MSDRLTTGSPQLDGILGGGFPRHAINLVVGPPGTGKTILAEQCLFHQAAVGRTGLFLSTVSEPYDKVLRFADELAFFDAAAVGSRVLYDEIGSTLVRDGLPGVVRRVDALLKDLGPDLLVVDSFRALHAFAADDADFRRFLHELAGRLTASVTDALWIGEYDRDSLRDAPEFAVADATVALEVRRAGARQWRVLQVLKLRGSDFASGEHSYRISGSGLDVYPRLADPSEPRPYSTGEVRQSTGIAELDDMLDGGCWPGATTLVTGPAGVGKTLLGLHFLLAGLDAGETGVLATFQEDGIQLGRVARGFGWSLDDPTLTVLCRSPVDVLVDQWAHELLDAIERTDARRVVVDSVADVERASPEAVRFRELLSSLVQRCVRRGTSLVLTLETEQLFERGRVAQSEVSELSDNVIHLRYRPGDELGRAVSVLKSRSSRHDAGAREFVITADGIVVGAEATATGAASARRDPAGRQRAPVPDV